jgi:hypothetical protein
MREAEMNACQKQADRIKVALKEAEELRTLSHSVSGVDMQLD